MSTKARIATLLVLVAVSVLCIGASVSWADITGDHIKLYEDTTRYSSSSGGEFQVEITAGSLPYVTSPQTKGDFANGFRTFCIQKSQSFNPNREYSVKVRTVTNHGTNVPLAPEAAYLFHLFNSGQMNLNGYAYSYTDGVGPGSRTESATHLQHVLWGFMAGDTVYGAWENAWRQQAIDDVASGKWKGLGAVRVLQLHPLSGSVLDAQDQLIETPEPGTLALLAVGALPALPFMRRRKPAA